MRENGRSMVEMLGVLAIIGVLSVGAIAGYSKAMLKYKLNKQTEQLSTLINAVIRYQSDLRVTVSETSHGVEPIISYLRKLNEIPVEMLYPPNDRKYDKYIKDALNNDINIFHHNTNYIGLGISLQDNNISKETCKNVYLLAKNFSGDLGFVETVFESEGSTQYSGHVYGDRFCTGNRLCFKNLKVTDIDDLCSACTGDAKNCSLLFGWYDQYF